MPTESDCHTLPGVSWAKENASTSASPLHSGFNVGAFLQGGIFHGRILLPPEYPFKPPSFLMLSPTGRFETHTKICLSISSHHPEHWQPSWSVRTALTALIAFFPTPGNGAIGSLVRGLPDKISARVYRAGCCLLSACCPDLWQGFCYQASLAKCLRLEPSNGTSQCECALTQKQILLQLVA